jgi:hypothetical protein
VNDKVIITNPAAYNSILFIQVRFDNKYTESLFSAVKKQYKMAVLSKYSP